MKSDKYIPSLDNVNLRSAAEKVLKRIKSMTNEELAAALESCANGPINYAFSMPKMPTANPLHNEINFID